MNLRLAWAASIVVGLLSLSGCKKETPPPPPPEPSCECGTRICGKVCENVCGTCADDGVCAEDGLSCRPALAVGASCSTDIDCGSGRLCLTTGSVNVPGGYCSKRCGGVEECPDGSVCGLDAQGQSRCFATCSSGAQCRSGEGYQCDPLGYCQACVGSCSGKTCGDDGCGNPCGVTDPQVPVCADESRVCSKGSCADSFVEVGALCCMTLADYRGWWDGAAFTLNDVALLLGGREVQRTVNGNDTQGVKRMVTYDSATNQIKSVLTPLPKTIAHPQAAFLGNYIYVAGGTADSDMPGVADAPITDVYKYDDNKVWAPMGSLPTPATTEGALIAHDNRLYLIGGSTADGQASSAMHVADPVGSTLTWDSPSAPPARPTASKLFAALSDGKRIWVIGGWDGSHEVATVETFDPASGWSTSLPLPAPVVGARAVLVGTKIYVFGGWNGPSVYNDPRGLVQTIDTKTGHTALLGRTPSYLAGQVPLVTRDGKVLLFGGFSSGLNGPVEHPEVFSFIIPSP
jgi:N-acetylneuraminic acid mutarotase